MVNFPHIVYLPYIFQGDLQELKTLHLKESEIRMLESVPKTDNISYVYNVTFFSLIFFQGVEQNHWSKLEEQYL